MHFTCTFDLKVPEKQRTGLYELLALANERLWLGHFGIERADGMPVYRHAVLLRGAPGASAESLEDMIDIAITECERFFPAFQFVLWGGKSAADALDAVMVYDWPGNVRELQNALEHAVVLSKATLIEPSALPERITRRRREPLVPERSPPNPSPE